MKLSADMKSLLVIALSILLIPVIYYKIKSDREDWDECTSEPNTAYIAYCMGEVASYWEYRMKQELGKANDEVKKSQQLWLKYKDEQMEIINEIYPGTGTADRYLRMAPIIKLYKSRALELQRER